MPIGGYGNVGKKTISSGDPTTATIFNVIITGPDVGVEKSQVLPANTKEFLIRTRGSGEMQFAYSSGDTSTLFLTVSGCSVYNDKNLYTSQTIFFQVDAIDVVEIIAYT